MKSKSTKDRSRGRRSTGGTAHGRRSGRKARSSEGGPYNSASEWGGGGTIAIDDGVLKLKKRKRVPYEFVLEALDRVSPTTRPMFGCTAVYVKEKIVLVLREKGGTKPDADDGVWIATSEEHHEGLRRDFPSMRSIRVLGNGSMTNWQVIPAQGADFEEAAVRACELVIAGDPRIGRVPKSRRKR